MRRYIIRDGTLFANVNLDLVFVYFSKLSSRVSSFCFLFCRRSACLIHAMSSHSNLRQTTLDLGIDKIASVDTDSLLTATAWFLQLLHIFNHFNYLQKSQSTWLVLQSPWSRGNSTSSKVMKIVCSFFKLPNVLWIRSYNWCQLAHILLSITTKKIITRSLLYIKRQSTHVLLYYFYINRERNYYKRGEFIR